jgi:hypothetical protein
VLQDPLLADQADLGRPDRRHRLGERFGVAREDLLEQLGALFGKRL